MISPELSRKILLSLILALGISFLLVCYVTYPNTPMVRPEFRQGIVDSPKLLASLVGRIAPKKTPPSLPPPWKSPGSAPLPIPTRLPINYPSPTRTLPPPERGTPTPTLVTEPPQPSPTPIPTEPSLPPTATPPPVIGNLTQQEQDIVSLINQRRQAMGLGQLAVNFQLVAAARGHSRDMAEHGLCSHSGSDGSTPLSRAQAAGFTGRLYGETVGCGYPTPQAIVDGWWGSPGHKAVLTNSGVTLIGVGWYNRYQTAMVGN
ncbi:CAP domain-containing protein [Candidatus Shapirobacteria bacterium]|nr:CAP domain-containing protein [Chloroflexota bacterium]MBM3208887.1 CAP domain-containing protein [Candidatus Shapirobacteria bacterium]